VPKLCFKFGFPSFRIAYLGALNAFNPTLTAHTQASDVFVTLWQGCVLDTVHIFSRSCPHHNSLLQSTTTDMSRHQCD